VPFEVHSGGVRFWEALLAKPERACVFDQCMVAINHLSSAIVHGYPWRVCDAVVDVAGGMGGLLAELLAHVPAIKQGVLFDLPAQIQAADKVRACVGWCVRCVCVCVWVRELPVAWLSGQRTHGQARTCTG
jgi:hypothetical protein